MSVGSSVKQKLMVEHPTWRRWSPAAALLVVLLLLLLSGPVASEASGLPAAAAHLLTLV